MAYEGPRTKQGTTPLQDKVWRLDQSGMRVRDISNELGISVSQVGNIKKWLREHGYQVSDLERVPSKIKPDTCVEKFLAETEIERSEFEPEDDEQPDADEVPFTDLDRCHCGLIKPCYHESVSVWQSGDGNRFVQGQNPSEMEPLQSTRVRWGR